MKKTILLISLIFFLMAGSAYGQLDHGKLMLGVASTYNMSIGNSDLFNMSFTKYKYSWAGEVTMSDKLFNINVIPRTGYFITKNLAAGLEAYYSYSRKIAGSTEDKYILSRFDVVPFVRYYKFYLWSYPFVELNVGLGALTDRFILGPYGTSGGDIETRYGIKSVGGGIGLAKPLGNRAIIDIMAGYSAGAVKNKENDYVTKHGAFLLKMGFMVFFMLPESY
jgi:hypothetical protein